MVSLFPPSAGRRVQLERPEEVGGVFKVLTNRVDLVDQVLNANYFSGFAKLGFYDRIRCDWNALFLNLKKSYYNYQIIFLKKIP